MLCSDLMCSSNDTDRLSNFSRSRPMEAQQGGGRGLVGEGRSGVVGGKEGKTLSL